MSLLMKALEKAAKDRGEARATETAAAPAGGAAAAAPAAPERTELTLEPITAETAPPSAREPVPRPAAATTAASGPAPISREREQAQAATVLQAGGRPRAGGAGAYLRAHPLVAIGTIGGLIAVGLGVYVYLQVSQPGSLVGPAVVAPGGPLPPLAQVPAPAEPPGALPSAPLLEASAAEAAAARPEAPAPPREKPRAPAPEPAPAEAPQPTILVSKGSPEPVLSPLLTQAYAAFEANRLAQAKDLYDRLLREEPRSIDALLGLAAIAILEGDGDEATRRYLRILDLDPRHALAQTGLIGILGRADPLAAETRLKQLIAREPSGYLYFTLGNLYADQSLWSAAQQAYFQAHHLEPANPDYAYNLAVGLEHVSQPKLALGFYRRAVALAAARGRASFNLAQVKERISSLASQVE